MKNMLVWIGIVIFSVLFFAVSVPASAQITGSDWTGAYYNNTTFAGSPVATVSYSNGVFANWGDGPPLQEDNATPVPGIGVDDFSARFTSTQTVSATGLYTFTVYVDDGIRIIIDGVVVLDEFVQNTTGSYRTFSFIRYVAASAPFIIVAEFVEFTGNAVVAIQWGLYTTSAYIPVIEPAYDAIVEGNVSPSLVWQHVGAQSYKVNLTSATGVSLLKASFPAGALCGSNCELDLAAIPFQPALQLANGLYMWRVFAQGTGENLSSYSHPFRIRFPGKPLALTPDFNQVVTQVSPQLAWGEVAYAAEYRIKLTRVKNGQTTVIDWLASADICDGVYCVVDLAAQIPPVVLLPGKYEWRVQARQLATAPNVARSKVAGFKVMPPTRGSALPAPLPLQFRAPG